MLTLDRNTYFDPRPVRFDLDDPSPVFDVYLKEITDAMHDAKIEALVEHIAAYEETGEVSAFLHDVLKRAQCLADADRITTIFDGPDIIMPRCAA